MRRQRKRNRKGKEVVSGEKQTFVVEHPLVGSFSPPWPVVVDCGGRDRGMTMMKV